MDKNKESTPLTIIGKSDEFKAGFYIGHTDRSAAIAKTLLGQGWSEEFVAKTVMLDEEAVAVIKRQME